MLDNFFENTGNQLNFSENDINQLSPLVLAYIGDSVYEIFIRTFLVSDSKASVHTLHKRSIQFVKAKAQSDKIHRISEFLTEDEQNMVRRGRNAKSGTIPKNADVVEYKYATGFEALLGYLYLKKDFVRLMEILKM